MCLMFVAMDVDRREVLYILCIYLHYKKKSAKGRNGDGGKKDRHEKEDSQAYIYVCVYERESKRVKK